MQELNNGVEGVTIDLPKLFCKRCGYNWHPRTTNLPKVCPNCKSPYWNRERIRRD